MNADRRMRLWCLLVEQAQGGPSAVDHVCHVVAAARRHIDLFEWGQRTTPFALAAEIQRRLLPGAFTCEADSFTLSAWLEPAATIGGDTFDYSLARDLLHLSITDAVGHGVHSALAASLCVGSLRNTRREGRTPLDQAQAANQALVAHAPNDFTFVTGILGRLDLRTGVLAMVNAGHPPPVLVRDGIARPLLLPIDRPFGVLAEETYRSTDVALRAGDRLVLLSDGVLERAAAVLDVPAQTAPAGRSAFRGGPPGARRCRTRRCRTRPTRCCLPTRPGLARRSRRHPFHQLRRWADLPSFTGSGPCASPFHTRMW